MVFFVIKCWAMTKLGIYTDRDILIGRFNDEKEFKEIIDSYFRRKPHFFKFTEYTVKYPGRKRYKLRYRTKIEYGDVYHYLYVKLKYLDLLKRLFNNKK